MTWAMDRQVSGRIVKGLRAASGASRTMRRGTIALQLPHFRKQMPDIDKFVDGTLHLGTLNVKVRNRRVQVAKPAYHLKDVRWERQTTEHFYLSPCVLRFSGKDYRGMLYIPDPATKPGGLPVGEVLEVLTARIPLIRYGAPVRLTFTASAIDLVPPCRVSQTPHRASPKTGYGAYR